MRVKAVRFNFEEGDLTNWKFLDRKKEGGTIEISSERTHSGTYALKVQTIEGIEWHYIGAQCVMDYQDVTDIKLEVWWYFERPCGIEFAFNKRTGERRYVSGLRWKPREKTWQWWQAGEGLGVRGVGVWTDFSPIISQELRSGMWHKFVMHSNMMLASPKYISLQSDNEIWDISQYPIYPFPPSAKSNYWKPALAIALNIGAGKAATQATIYYDDIALSYEVERAQN